MSLGRLRRSLGGTGGGVLESFRRREDFVSRSGRGRLGEKGGGGPEGSKEELAGESGGDVGGVAS